MSEYPYDLDIKALLVEVNKTDISKNPNISRTVSGILKDGPRTFVVATVLFIRNAHTGEFHHHELKLEQWKKSKSGWEKEDYRTITINNKDEDKDEIRKLLSFISTYNLLENEGEFVILDTKDFGDVPIKKILENIKQQQKLPWENILTAIQENSENLQDIINLAVSFPNHSALITSAINLGKFSAALATLKELIERNPREQEFQTLFEENSWMFGSEYNQLMPKRTFFADEKLDFLLQRTIDNYVEIIEIKRPKVPLFKFDDSHNSLFPSSELSQVIGQVIKYLDTLERNQVTIKDREGIDIRKIRAKIIIGRDGDTKSREALKNLNSHLHRIEIITYDQLLRSAQWVIEKVQKDTKTLSTPPDSFDF